MQAENPKASQNQQQPVVTEMISIGEAARYLRNRFGLSQRDAAAELGISYVHLSNIENGKALPSPTMLDKYREAWGIDLYMLAVGMFSDEETVPKPLRASVKAMTEAWKAEIEDVIQRRYTEANE